jgi:hypothetical protein
MLNFKPSFSVVVFSRDEVVAKLVSTFTDSFGLVTAEVIF